MVRHDMRPVLIDPAPAALTMSPGRERDGRKTTTHQKRGWPRLLTDTVAVLAQGLSRAMRSRSPSFSARRTFSLNKNRCRTQKANSTLRASRAVPHPSTDRAFRRLTSEFGWDRVYSTKYGRWRKHPIPRTHEAAEAPRRIRLSRWKTLSCHRSHFWLKGTERGDAFAQPSFLAGTTFVENQTWRTPNTKSQQHPKGFRASPTPVLTGPFAA